MSMPAGAGTSPSTISWLLGLFVPYPIVAATNSQVAARVTLQIADLVAALATGAVGAVALARPISPTPCPAWPSPSPWCRPWPSSG
jgi:hypothetical protein